MAKNDRTVFKRGNEWVNKRNDSTKASSVHDTQKDAVKSASEMLKNQGGGDLTVKGVDGKIRSKDTIGKPDPMPPKDTEH